MIAVLVTSIQLMDGKNQILDFFKNLLNILPEKRLAKD